MKFYSRKSDKMKSHRPKDLYKTFDAILIFRETHVSLENRQLVGLRFNPSLWLPCDLKHTYLVSGLPLMRTHTLDKAHLCLPHRFSTVINYFHGSTNSKIQGHPELNSNITTVSFQADLFVNIDPTIYSYVILN